MGFRLSKSVILHDFERRNDHYLEFFAEFGSFGADYIKVVEDRPIQSATKCSPKNLVFSDISFMAIFTEVTENERIIDRHLHDVHPLLDYNASESQSVLSI